MQIWFKNIFINVKASFKTYKILSLEFLIKEQTLAPTSLKCGLILVISQE
jgi:hypothetical protein